MAGRFKQKVSKSGRSKPRKVLPNGRNANSGNFLMMEYWMFESHAYRELQAGPRSLLWELIRLFNGRNNGRIGLGVRSAAQRLNVSKDTASSYFKSLVEAGFIVATRSGGFNMKDPTSRRATEWRLTWHPSDEGPATKEFMRPRLVKSRS